LPYRTVTIETPDHAQLYSWVIEPQASADQHTTIVEQLLFHARMLVSVG
jgi:uncharacterized protein